MKARASPNIALIKYWGKLNSAQDLDRNLATNPSLSLTLSRAQTLVDLDKLEDPKASDIYVHHQLASPGDKEKILQHWVRVQDYLGLPQRYGLKLKSANNFPAGTGIASSASSYAAITAAMVAELSESAGLTLKMSEMSALARRGSGSACRSLEGPWVKWDGRFAQKMSSKWALRDTILILSTAHKKVPSSQGHLAATSSPFFKKRLAKIPDRIQLVESAIARQSLQDLIPVMEEEAEELHKIVESSSPGITYKTDQTRAVLAEIRQLGSRDFGYTLDAGPNIHILSEVSVREPLERILKKLRIVAEVWEDFAGQGVEWVGSAQDFG